MDIKITAPKKVEGQIVLPQSKSIVNRLLMIQALKGEVLIEPKSPCCDDCFLMRVALTSDADYVNVDNAGTAMRFLTAFYAVREGRIVTIDCSDRMKQRPIKQLVDALNCLGAEIQYLEKDGFPPLKIVGRELHSGSVSLTETKSSQYVSALMMIAPVIGGLTIHLAQKMPSMSYVMMTAALMRQMGAKVEVHSGSVVVNNGYGRMNDTIAELDWSAASYWLGIAALSHDCEVVLDGLSLPSIQGDSEIAGYSDMIGCDVVNDETSIKLRGKKIATSHYLVTLNLMDTPDIAQTLVVVCCLKNLRFVFTGLRSLRIKETDRIEALKTEMKKLGFVVKDIDSTLYWAGDTTQPEQEPCIDTYGDHRMAMAFALSALRFKNVTIRSAEVVSKSYPSFWEDLESVGFKIERK